MASEEVRFKKGRVQKARTLQLCSSIGKADRQLETLQAGAHHQGKRPVSSWYSIMPKLHMSASRPYSRLNTSAEGRAWNQVH